MALNDNYTGIYLFRIFNKKNKSEKSTCVFTLMQPLLTQKGWKLINCEIKIHIRLKFYDLRYFILSYTSYLHTKYHEKSLIYRKHDTILAIKFQINYIAILA